MNENAKFITAGDSGHPFNIFWHPGQPDRIHMATSDSTFTDETGGKPGIRVVFSSNPRSADYNPATFNRLKRVDTWPQPQSGRLEVVPGESESAAALVFVEYGERRHHLAGDESVVSGDVVDDVEGLGDVFGGVDDDGGDRDVSGQLKELVAVRFVVAVESPNPP
jgi:hypothetical protein